MHCLAPLSFQKARLLGVRLLGRGYWSPVAKHTASVGWSKEVAERGGTQLGMFASSQPWKKSLLGAWDLPSLTQFAHT